MTWWKDIPPRWWAVMVGVAFGSLALITITGAKEGYSKSVLSAVGIAPFLCMFAGAMLPNDTSLEMAALVGGIAALGGTTLILSLSKRAPVIFGAAAEAAAKSFLELREGETTRIKPDGTPAMPDPVAEQLVEELKERDDEG